MWSIIFRDTRGSAGPLAFQSRASGQYIYTSGDVIFYIRRPALHVYGKISTRAPKQFLGIHHLHLGTVSPYVPEISRLSFCNPILVVSLSAPRSKPQELHLLNKPRLWYGDTTPRAERAKSLWAYGIRICSMYMYNLRPVNSCLGVVCKFKSSSPGRGKPSKGPHLPIRIWMWWCVRGVSGLPYEKKKYSSSYFRHVKSLVTIMHVEKKSAKE